MWILSIDILMKNSRFIHICKGRIGFTKISLNSLRLLSISIFEEELLVDWVMNPSSFLYE